MKSSRKLVTVADTFIANCQNIILHTLIVSFLFVGAITASNTTFANEPIKPIKTVLARNPGMVELGKMLYFDPRLSKSGFISCNSCHNLSMGGTDNIKTSIGHNWQQGPINAPTVLNSSMSLAQFWDGRSKDLKDQAGKPIPNPGEMALPHEIAVDVLRSIPQYRSLFQQVFG